MLSLEDISFSPPTMYNMCHSEAQTSEHNSKEKHRNFSGGQGEEKDTPYRGIVFSEAHRSERAGNFSLLHLAGIWEQGQKVVR